MSIPIVASRPAKLSYRLPMTDWQKRMRAHLKQHRLSHPWVATVLAQVGLQVTPGAIGHWLTGAREINLTDFFLLCEAVGADPCKILFGTTIRQASMEIVHRLVAAEPDTNSHYRPFEQKLKRTKRKTRNTMPTKKP